jgi:hypothetical protein
MAGGTDRLVDLAAAGIAADLLHLVLQFRHLAALRLLLNLLLLLLYLGLDLRLVDVLCLHRIETLLLELHVWTDGWSSIGAVGEREFATAAATARSASGEGRPSGLGLSRRAREGQNRERC